MEAKGVKGPARKLARPNARERAAARREQAAAISELLARTYPDADCELDYRSAWELLVATILSAQCTDKMVNSVTPALFEEYPDPRALASADPARVEVLIKKTGFFRQKAKAILTCAHRVVDEFGGEVPDDFDALTTLPGVGRKTASVVIGTAFHRPAVFVDTHVKRLSKRLGLTRSDEPDDVERDLKDSLPDSVWTAFCHRMIHHGRRVCFARKPACDSCTLAPRCPRIGVESLGKSKR